MIFLIYLFEFIGIIICFIFAIVFLTIPKPKEETYKSYRISIKTLSTSYFIIAILFSFFLYFHLEKTKIDALDFATILISSLQAILFTFISIKIFNTKYKFSNFLKAGIFPIILMIILYTLALIFDKYNFIENPFLFYRELYKPDILIRFLFFLIYISQIIYFTFLFEKEKELYRKKMLNYFSETHEVNLSWVKFTFYYALTIGLLVLLTQFYPALELNLFVSIAVVIFYFVFAVKYLDYTKIYKQIQPSINEEISKNTKNQQIETINNKKSNEITETVNLPLNRQQFFWKTYQEEMLTEKYFLIQGLTLKDLAQKLAIGRTTLSSLINTQEGVSFNFWINNLRIEFSKKLLLKHPEYSISEIAEQSGYTEASNFSRHFKQITGKTPSVWRNLKELQST